MKREILDLSLNKDKDEWLRKRLDVITSSDVPALFNLHDYGLSPLKLFEQKRNKISENIDNPYTRAGNYLQGAIATMFSKEYGFAVEDFDKFIQCPEQGIGSSFDYLITGKLKIDPLSDPTMIKNRLTILSLLEKHGAGILEIKNVHHFKNLKDWTQKEATAYIELQLQHQLLVSGKKWGVIAGLVGGCELVVFVREFDEAKGQEILKRTRSFWEAVVKNNPPQKQEEDFERLNKESRSYSDEIIDASENSYLESLAEEYFTQRNTKNKAVKKMEVLKHKAFEAIGEARGAESDYFKISAGTSKDTPEITVTIAPEHVGQTFVLQKRRAGSRRITVNIKGLGL